MKFEIIKNSQTIKLVEKLIDELDNLYDDLTYDNDDAEIQCIKSKIKIREEMLKQLGQL